MFRSHIKWPRLYNETVGNVATCGLRAPNNLDHLAALQAVVARHRVCHLDARQQRVLQTAAVSESAQRVIQLEG